MPLASQAWAKLRRMLLPSKLTSFPPDDSVSVAVQLVKQRSNAAGSNALEALVVFRVVNGIQIDFIFGVINWSYLADQRSTDELMLEIDQALEENPAAAPLSQPTGWDESDEPADIDLVELNEAFAAQAIACMRELALDPARVNV